MPPYSLKLRYHFVEKKYGGDSEALILLRRGIFWKINTLISLLQHTNSNIYTCMHTALGTGITFLVIIPNTYTISILILNQIQNNFVNNK